MTHAKATRIPRSSSPESSRSQHISRGSPTKGRAARNAETPPGTVRIGGQYLPYALAAFVAVEADRRQVIPRKVLGQVAVPDACPKEVKLAGKRLSLRTAALIAEAADRLAITPVQMIASIVEEHTTRRRPSARR